MLRRDLISLLLNRPMSVTEIARAIDASPREAGEDVDHLLQSLQHMPFRASVSPAHCRKCSFAFGPGKLRKPSKCPNCRSTWIAEARIAILPK